ncbi:MAG: putative zinc-binding protein [Syntrophaceae bacterium]
MKESKTQFSIAVDVTKGVCPMGQHVGNQNRNEGKIPVISCEGACIRGEIARLAAHLVAKEEPYRRGCHGEMFTVPASAIAQWMNDAEKVIVIDGCFLHCHGRVLKNLIDKDKIAQFDALSVYNKYTDIFDIEGVPEEERKNVARKVADKVLADMKQGKRVEETTVGCGGCAK